MKECTKVKLGEHHQRTDMFTMMAEQFFDRIDTASNDLMRLSLDKLLVDETINERLDRTSGKLND